jgi:hypothetical protein
MASAQSDQQPLRFQEDLLGPMPPYVETSVFSKDGCHVAFVLQHQDKQLVVVDGQPGPVHDWTGEIIFSPDGKPGAPPLAVGFARL